MLIFVLPWYNTQVTVALMKKGLTFLQKNKTPAFFKYSLSNKDKLLKISLLSKLSVISANFKKLSNLFLSKSFSRSNSVFVLLSNWIKFSFWKNSLISSLFNCCELDPILRKNLPLTEYGFFLPSGTRIKIQSSDSSTSTEKAGSIFLAKF